MGRRTHGGISVRVGTRGEVLSAADHRGPQLSNCVSLGEKPDFLKRVFVNRVGPLASFRLPLRGMPARTHTRFVSTSRCAPSTFLPAHVLFSDRSCQPSH